MCRFIETIKVADGKTLNLGPHLRRMMVTAGEFGFDCPQVDRERLEEMASATGGTAKLRFTYDRDGIHDITCTPYKMRRIDRLRLVCCDTVEYQFKYENRSALERLRTDVKAGEEILIVKNGLLTDTTYTNVALHDGTRWVTPRRPLLAGTKRAELIDDGVITEGDIRPSDVKDFNRVALFNAMIELGEIVMPVSAIMT